MYDRYTITLKSDELALTLGAEVPEEYVPQFNAAPTKKLPIIKSVSYQKITFSQWGLMSKWSNNKTMSPKLFNLPIESIRTKTSYLRKLKTHRCVIPMDGFFVWKQIAKKRLVPHYFYYPNRRVFSVAGLWEETDDNETSASSFIMITKPSDSNITDYQEDMPLILNAPLTRKWLEAEETITIDDFSKDDQGKDLIFHTVSPKIKDVEANDGSFINPAPASDQHGNYTLFA